MSDGCEAPILLIEDSEADARLTMRALTHAGMTRPIILCRDGDQALDYLDQYSRPHAPRDRRPAMILLDLNMPGSDGRYILRQIKSNQDLKTIPVIVLTTSDDQDDIAICYQYGANGYVKKPDELTDFKASMAQLVAYWLNTNLAP